MILLFLLLPFRYEGGQGFQALAFHRSYLGLGQVGRSSQSGKTPGFWGLRIPLPWTNARVYVVIWGLDCSFSYLLTRRPMICITLLRGLSYFTISLTTTITAILIATGRSGMFCS